MLVSGEVYEGEGGGGRNLITQSCRFVILYASQGGITHTQHPHTYIHTHTGFLLYSAITIGLSVYLIFWVAPQHGQTNILVYVAICSLIGSLSVMACKGLSIAIKLTFMGDTQLFNPLAWFFAIAVATCIMIQMNYLNRALDIFNTSLVTPIYYVMFTTLTIIASAILFKEWSKLTTSDVIGAMCGFMTIVCGVFLLHAFKDQDFMLSDLMAGLTAAQRGSSERRRGSASSGGSSSSSSSQHRPRTARGGAGERGERLSDLQQAHHGSQTNLATHSIEMEVLSSAGGGSRPVPAAARLTNHGMDGSTQADLNSEDNTSDNEVFSSHTSLLQ